METEDNKVNEPVKTGKEETPKVEAPAKPKEEVTPPESTVTDEEKGPDTDGAESEGQGDVQSSPGTNMLEEVVIIGEIPEEVHGKFKFGKTSNKRMLDVNVNLVMVARYALSTSDELDWGVGPYGGKRSAEEQLELYSDGRSRADGTKKKSYHQTGLALDLVPVIDGKMTWENIEAFMVIQKKMFKAWNKLKREGRIPDGFYLHWGGYWSAKDKNADGVMQVNEKGWDLPHFEIRTLPQKKKFRNELKAI